MIKMIVQWQLVVVNTDKLIRVGKEFELVDLVDDCFDGSVMDWGEACILFGDPTVIKPQLGSIDSKGDGL